MPWKPCTPRSRLFVSMSATMENTSHSTRVLTTLCGSEVIAPTFSSNPFRRSSQRSLAPQLELAHLPDHFEISPLRVLGIEAGELA